MVVDVVTVAWALARDVQYGSTPLYRLVITPAITVQSLGKD